MNPVAATTLIAQTFDSPFDETAYAHFVANLLNQVDRAKAFGYRSGNIIPQAFRGQISTYTRPFVYYDPNGERLDVLAVRLKNVSGLARARTMQRNFIAHYLKKEHADVPEAVLAAFYHEDVADWRFSFVRLEYAFGDDGAEEKLTPARRYSYLVGPTEPTHTAESQLHPFLVEDGANPTIADLAAAFQVETVSRQFFEEYTELFLRLVEGIEGVLKTDKRLAADFERAGVNVLNFAKKLLGQIVFLYFVQKKGWLGVAPADGSGRNWGSGPKDFLRRLFDRRNGVAYDNFFNDVLEPLFYDALAIERPDNLFTIGDWACRIPFLNGGLFEPMGNYDWRHTRLLLPNSLFSDRQNADDDSGTGILDVFDRYNFTVWEEEPLEKEVAVDPEMLGKVFENLLEVQDRKSKGAFYTPREIVHYMCQESLINYLDTSINMVAGGLADEKPVQADMFGEAKPQQKALRALRREERVPRDDLAVLVRQGALALQQDAAKEAGLKSGDYVLPQSVRDHARALDNALAQIKLCDPAIGSGAFPVGMLHEIVQARQALGTYLGTGYLTEFGPRSPYGLKRHAIQESIYGVDIDAGAVEIAKLRLWLSLVVDEESYADIQPLPNLDYKIVCGNSLLGVEKNLFNNHLFVQLGDLKRKFFEETHPHEKATLKAKIDQLLELLTGEQDVFDFEVYFHEVFAAQAGFDVVIGNPPYVRMELFKELKPVLKQEFPQVYSGRADLYVYFYSRGLEILRNTGTLAFISSNKFMRAKYGEKLRKLFSQEKTIHSVIDFGDLPVFDATAYPSIVILVNKKPDAETVAMVLNVDSLNTLRRLPYEVNTMAWKMPQSSLLPGGWALVSPKILTLMQKLRGQHTTLERYVDGKIFYGIKTGYNKAFVIDESVRQKLIADDPQSAEQIKPWLRGRDVARWSVSYAGLYVIFMPHGVDIDRYPILEDYLNQFKDRLENRATSHLHPWYEMQQPQMGCYREYERPKIIYPDIAKRPSFAYDDSGAFITNTLYVIPTTEKHLLGILNSNVVHFFYSQVSTQVRGDYLRFIAQYVKQIPIPKVDSKDKKRLEYLVNQLLLTEENEERINFELALNTKIYEIFNLTPEEIDLIEESIDIEQNIRQLKEAKDALDKLNAVDAKS